MSRESRRNGWQGSGEELRITVDYRLWIKTESERYHYVHSGMLLSILGFLITMSITSIFTSTYQTFRGTSEWFRITVNVLRMFTYNRGQVRAELNRHAERATALSASEHPCGYSQLISKNRPWGGGHSQDLFIAGCFIGSQGRTETGNWALPEGPHR